MNEDELVKVETAITRETVLAVMLVLSVKENRFVSADEAAAAMAHAFEVMSDKDLAAESFPLPE